MAGLFAERIGRLINFRLIEPDFDGTAKLDEFYRLPTLSIFKKKPEVEKEEGIEFIEQSLEDTLPAMGDT